MSYMNNNNIARIASTNRMIEFLRRVEAMTRAFVDVPATSPLFPMSNAPQFGVLINVENAATLALNAYLNARATDPEIAFISENAFRSSYRNLRIAFNAFVRHVVRPAERNGSISSSLVQGLGLRPRKLTVNRGDVFIPAPHLEGIQCINGTLHMNVIRATGRASRQMPHRGAVIRVRHCISEEPPLSLSDYSAAVDYRLSHSKIRHAVVGVPGSIAWAAVSYVHSGGSESAVSPPVSFVVK